VLQRVMGRSPRVAALLLLTAMGVGRVIALGCELTCVDQSNSQSRDGASVARAAGEHCHEAADGSGDPARLAAASTHDACNHDAWSPTILTAKSQYNAALNVAVATPILIAYAVSRVSGQQLREHTPPGLHPAPIVSLRI